MRISKSVKLLTTMVLTSTILVGSNLSMVYAQDSMVVNSRESQPQVKTDQALRQFQGVVRHKELLYQNGQFVEGNSIIADEVYTFDESYIGELQPDGTRSGMPMSVAAKGDQASKYFVGDGFMYVGAYSVDGGPISYLTNRVYEMTYKEVMPVVTFYYARPILCNEGSRSLGFEVGDQFTCYESIPETAGGRQDRMSRYINGYLTKGKDVTEPFNTTKKSDFVFNYVPLFMPADVLAVTNVRAEGSIDKDTSIRATSTTDTSNVYVSDALNSKQVNTTLTGQTALNGTQTIRLNQGGATIKHINDLVRGINGSDMNTWVEDGLALTLTVPNSVIEAERKRATAIDGTADTGSVTVNMLINAKFEQSYKSITGINHLYQSVLTYNGIPFFADYVNSTLDLEGGTIHRTTSTIAAQIQNYKALINTSAEPSWRLTVGFESRPELLDTKSGYGGQLWYDASVLELYNEYISLAETKPGTGRSTENGDTGACDFTVATNADGTCAGYDVSNSPKVQTQRAVDLTTDIIYANDLLNKDVPYVNEDTKNGVSATSNILTFNRDKMNYLVNLMDTESAGFLNGRSGVIDMAKTVNDLVLRQKQLSYVFGRTFKLPYRYIIPMDIGLYTGDNNTKSQVLKVVTKDVFAVGADSGLVYAVPNGRKQFEPADWKSGILQNIFKNGGMYDPTTSTEANPIEIVKYLNDNYSNEYKQWVYQTTGAKTLDMQDNLVTSNTGSMYFTPLNVGPTKAGTSNKQNFYFRLNVEDVGLNDFTLQSDQFMNYTYYLVGHGDNAIYTAQKGNITGGEKPNTVYKAPFTLTKALNDQISTATRPNDWIRVNETRMMYTGNMIEQLIESGNVDGSTVNSYLSNSVVGQ